eukprot:2055596-Amphidinium_carterae.1
MIKEETGEKKQRPRVDHFSGKVDLVWCQLESMNNIFLCTKWQEEANIDLFPEFGRTASLTSFQHLFKQCSIM